MPYCRECSALVPDDAERCPTCGSALDVPSESEIITEETAIDTDALEKELSRSIKPQYEVLNLLGVGGMGAVFLAREPALKRLVAVKVLAPELAANRKARARFEREARAAAAISHPNVVRVYAVGQTAKQELPYIIMQYVEGVSLAEWIRQRPRVSEREARRIVAEVAAGLAAAHTRDLVHRDVKPGNVLIEAETGRAFVADFGVAAAAATADGKDLTRLTATGIVVGTPVYMSPEQAAGSPATPKSDVYSLGMLAYEMLTGRLPFEAETAMGWVAAHVKDRPTPVSQHRGDLSPEVVQLVDRALAKEPRRRPTADEISRGMLPTLATEIDWPPPGLREIHRVAGPVARVGTLAALAGLLTLIVLAFTPDIIQVHPHWLERFEVSEEVEGARIVTRATSPDQGDVSFFVWQVGMLVSAVVFGIGMLYFANALVRLSAKLVHQRNLGWRWGTLFDVVADPDGRSGFVLRGSREFASLDDKVRRAILRARKLRAAFQLLAGGWVMAAVGAWSLLVTAGIAGPGVPAPLAGTDVLLASTIPALVLLVLAALATVRERHLIGPLGRARSFTVTPEDVNEWYRSAGGATAEEPPSYAGWMRTRRIRQVAALASALLVAVVLAGLVLLLLTSFVAARFVQRIAPQSAALVPTLDRIAAQDPLAHAREAWRRYLPNQPLQADSTSATLVQQLLNRGRGSLPSYPSSVSSVLAGEASLAWAIRAAADGRLPSDTVQLLEVAAEHPRTEALRRLAQTGDVDFFSVTQAAPIERIGYQRLPVPATGNLAEPGRANVFAAILALNRGDAAGAFTHLGENAAVFEQALQVPMLLPNLITLRLIREHVLQPLALFEEATGQSDRAADARQASRLLESLRFGIGGMSGLAANPTDLAVFRRALLDAPLLPGHRAELLVAGVWGLCANPSEILTGPGALRREVLVALADSAPMPHARAIVESTLEFARSPDPPDDGIAAGVERALQRAGGGAAHRMTLCAF